MTGTIEHNTENGKEPTEVLALNRCDTLIDWYQRQLKKQRAALTTTRLVAVVLSGLVPVLVIVQMSLTAQTPNWLAVSILIALFPALAAISSALDELFQYKENWIRFSIATEELKSEKVKFLTRTTKAYQRDLDEYEALSNFVTRIERITLRETRRWQSQVEEAAELDELLKSMGK